MEPGVQTCEETLDAGQRLVPRFGLAAGAGAAAPRAGRAVRLGLLDPVEAGREAAGRAARHRTAISPTCTPGPRSICPAPAGWASIRPRACWPAKATCRWPPRPIPVSAAPITGTRGPLRGRVRLRTCRSTRDCRSPARHQALHRRAMGARSSSLGHKVDARLDGRRRAADHGRRADLRLDRRHGRPGVEHRPPMGPQKRRLAGDLLPPSGPAVRPRGRCCTSARASGIPASRCPAGRWAATGEATASRSGTTRN